MRSVGILTQRVVPLLTAAGQCRIFTGLSPLRLMAVPHQNRYEYPNNNTIRGNKAHSMDSGLAESVNHDYQRASMSPVNQTKPSNPRFGKEFLQFFTLIP